MTFGEGTAMETPAHSCSLVARALSSTLLASAAAVVCLPARANLLVNGSFEDPVFIAAPGADHYVKLAGDELTGWLTPQIVLFDSMYDPVSDGRQAVQIETASLWISQSFATAVGARYELSFDLMAYSVYQYVPCPCTSTVRVNVGSLEATADGSSAGFTRYTFEFEATAGMTTLTFTNPAGPGMVNYPELDNVSVVLVPEVAEPGRVELLLAGLGLVFASIRWNQPRSMRESP